MRNVDFIAPQSLLLARHELSPSKFVFGFAKYHSHPHAGADF